MGECIYVYCVTQEPCHLIEQCKLNVDLYSLEHHGLRAVARTVSTDDFAETKFQENVKNTVWLKTWALEHHEVLASFVGVVTFLPFKFATVFHSEKNVLAMLDKHEMAMKERLRKLTGMLEYGVKARVDDDAVKGHVATISPEVRAFDQELAESSPGKAFFLKKKKEIILEHEVQSFFERHMRESMLYLASHAQENTLPACEMADSDGNNGLKAEFLVKQAEKEVFLHEFEARKRALGVCGIHLECTGPWPPYNFADFSVQ
ncbi:GvpL/GvpF family gas vesicle protein [Prosthecochloris sp. SCSIO W1102]|uniref:GvpL/GvpF family gas vesicle protein n=1 Tax=Prosthecochloris sp. SCSIO W1102 TaxID=2992243 RepID=UPI00223E89D8|nr:GvpL/GvpF family gas vesicle protein [Prosthecochloris sp. SCSIO W1102]UZJ39203.1 GvpL/GvpF family gas vesicle protein [Prosthecochloris sp. SCSIO W1102]